MSQLVRESNEKGFPEGEAVVPLVVQREGVRPLREKRWSQLV